MSLRTDIKGKRVLLLGACGVLGRRHAEILAEQGASLAFADRPGSDVLALAESLGAQGVEVDVTDEAGLVAGVAAAEAALGGLDGAIYNAAITSEGLAKQSGTPFPAFEDYPTALWQASIDVNLTGAFLFAREAGKALKRTGSANGGSSLINVASIYGVVAPDHRIYDGQPFNSFPGYAASKAGIIGLTRWLATLWADSGIRVNAVSPGGVYNDHDPAFAAAYGNRTPMGRMAERDEITGILVYLLSDSARYCTGQNFVIDGGLSAW